MYYLLKCLINFDENIKDVNNLDIYEEENLKAM